MNTNHIINDYIEALSERAELAGDGRLDYAMGFLYSTLESLKLQNYELEQLQIDIKNLRKLVPSKEVETLDSHWDCECKERYIHAKADRMACPICGSEEADSSDSRLSFCHLK